MLLVNEELRGPEKLPFIIMRVVVIDAYCLEKASNSAFSILRGRDEDILDVSEGGEGKREGGKAVMGQTG
jgi:hypothetical protein